MDVEGAIVHKELKLMRLSHIQVQFLIAAADTESDIFMLFFYIILQAFLF